MPSYPLYRVKARALHSDQLDMPVCSDDCDGQGGPCKKNPKTIFSSTPADFEPRFRHDGSSTPTYTHASKELAFVGSTPATHTAVVGGLGGNAILSANEKR